MRATIAILLAGLTVFAVALSGCGEEDVADAVEDVTTNAGTDATDGADIDRDALERELSEAERILDEQLPELSEARSLDDLSEAAEGIREDLDESVEDLGEVDLEAEPELDEARDEVETALSDLRTQLEEVESAVEDGDLERSLGEAADAIGDRQRVEDAIEDVRALLER